MSWQISGSTRQVGLIGDPVLHSLSPALHNAAYRALGLDLVYSAFPIAAGDTRAALHGARSLGFVGLSVTTPHKEAIALAADQRTPRAERIGSANTILFTAGVSVADSTDGQGLLDDLARTCAFDPSGARCAVLGAGSTARDIALALGEAGAAEVVIVNRTERRAASAALLAGAVGSVGSVEDLARADLVVNATSISLVQSDDAHGAAAELAEPLHEGQLVVDVVYRPPLSVFLTEAQARGAKVHNGLGMLVHQAARQVELFAGEPAPIEAMWAAVEAEAN